MFYHDVRISLFLRTLGTNWKPAMQRTQHLMVAIIIIFTVGGAVAVPLMPDLSKVQKYFTKVINENRNKVKVECGKGTPCHKQCLLENFLKAAHDPDKKLGKVLKPNDLKEKKCKYSKIQILLNNYITD